MPTYEWKNIKTGEIVSVTRSFSDHNVPPNENEEWVRHYGTVSIGQVPGAGGSPFRSSIPKKNNEKP
jgi:hypothetical protein